MVPALANALSYLAGTLASYVLNAKFGFKVRVLDGQRIASFFLVAVSGAILSSAAIAVVLQMDLLDPLQTKAAVMVPILVLQFLANWLFTFKTRGDKSNEKL